MWQDPEQGTRKRRPETSAPLFEESGLSVGSGTQCENGGCPDVGVSALPPDAKGSSRLSQAHARRTDPQPSHSAAAKICNLGRTRDRILAILRVHGPLTDEEIAWHWKTFGQAPIDSRVSPSGLRSRRSELVRLNLVRSRGTTKNSNGNDCTVWEAVK